MKSTVATSDLQRNRAWWLETAMIFVLCFLKSGWPPPDANEAHYLAKARHYWDPAWCEQDFFLNSADAHTVFYWTFGWICAAVSLPAAAWIGRVVTWLLVAWAWQRLSFALVPVRFAAVLSGGLMLVLSTIGHMAGEWIIGGVEAKSFAFVLVFLGLEQLVRGRWQAVWPLLGSAAAFHVLLGGWAVVAAGIAWLLSGREQLSLVKMLPSLAIGFALSLLGLVPVLLLNRGVDAATLQEANLIYVFERLPHHLVFNQFPHLYMARHAALAMLFVLLYWYLRKDDATGSVKRLTNFVLGALAITGVGIVIDQTTLHHELLAANLLRFYWYRLSDAIIPCGVALLLPLALRKLQLQAPQVGKLCVAAASIGVIAPLLAWNIDRQQHLLPGAVLQSSQAVKSAATFDDVRAEFVDWRNA
ncbi:MAG TPA: hypothetical protein VL096_11800, partial [Pirellulaceae bacterium]|nr:hypothetical protein [Pirellulaceae bacterium]